jgi:TolB protein
MELSHPDWSSDGSRIIYQAGTGKDAELYVLEVGGEPSPLTNNEQADHCPDWNLDGSQIAFSRVVDNGNEDIFVMDKNGNNEKNLTEDYTGVDRCPTWSPDGRLIAFESDRDGTENIWLMNANGTGKRQLTDSPPVQGPAAWSPDGNWLAFTTKETGNWNIYLISWDGKKYENLIRNNADDVFPVWVEELSLGLAIPFNYNPKSVD